MSDTPSLDRADAGRARAWTTSSLTRRGLLAGTLGTVLLAATACGDTSTDASSSAATSAPSTSTSASGSSQSVPTLATLVAQVKPKFTQATYTDATTGQVLPYNVFLPQGYDASTKYPLVLYIADSSLVGQDVSAPLSQYGALIWGSEADQAKHPSVVIVPEYPSVIIDDNNGAHTMSAYVEMTARLLTWAQGRYSIDPARVYGTGQSMGCMTVMYLAAQHPDLFAAELFVSGQWQISQLAGLATQKFFSIAAGGDAKASAGQAEVKKMLTADGVKYVSATWDATWSPARSSAAAAKIFAAGDAVNFATFTTGTVLKVAGSSSSGTAGTDAMGGPPPSGEAGPSGGGPSGAPPSGMGAGGSSEHMASFQPAYEITALRDWLFQQSA